MENKKLDKKLDMKCSITPYGVCVYALMLIFAGILFFVGIILLPKPEGGTLLIVCALVILYSFCLIKCKYLNYIILNDKTVSTKKRQFTWDEVYITMSIYNFHKGERGDPYFIFFDDHYLSKDEIYSRRVKKGTFFMTVTPKNLEFILQNYNKKIQLLDHSRISWKRLYNRVIEYNSSIDKIQESDNS